MAQRFKIETQVHPEWPLSLNRTMPKYSLHPFRMAGAFTVLIQSVLPLLTADFRHRMLDVSQAHHGYGSWANPAGGH